MISGELFCGGCYGKDHASICTGCETPVVEQLVEICNGGVKQSWHSECYTIYKTWDFMMRGALAVKRSGEIWTDAEGRELDIFMFQSRHQSAMAAISRISTKLSEIEEKAVSAIGVISKHVSDGMFSRGILGAAVLISIIGAVFTALDANHDRQANVSRKGNKRSHLL
jgi:hypothetical protein